MLKWIFVLLIAVGIYYAVQNWPVLGGQWNEALTRMTGAPPSQAVAQWDGSKIQVRVPLSVESWSVRNVAGLRVNLPFALYPYTASQRRTLPPNVRVESYAGKAGAHEVLLVRMTVTNLVGGMPLWVFNKPLAEAADEIQVETISSNSATTLLNGFRARRSDYISKSNPRMRYRCVLLERGNQAWFIETHAPENDAGGEDLFQKVGTSAQAL